MPKIFSKMKKSNKWETRFLEMARLVSGWSKDPSTKVGAVIVRPDKTIASVGYNGIAIGVKTRKPDWATEIKSCFTRFTQNKTPFFPPKNRLTDTLCMFGTSTPAPNVRHQLFKLE